MKRKKHMSRKAREELVSEIALRYAKAGKKEKGAILDEAVEDTGYNRKYLISKLSKKAFAKTAKGFDGKSRKKAYRKKPQPSGKRGRPREYDEALQASLTGIWEMFDMMCSKRLVKLIHDNITAIASYPPFHIRKGDEEKLEHLSAASADRLLRPARDAMRMKGKSGTRSPGSSLNAEKIAANLVDRRGELGIMPFTLRTTADGIRLLFVGVITDYVNIWESRENLEGLEITDSVLAADVGGETVAECDGHEPRAAFHRSPQVVGRVPDHQGLHGSRLRGVYAFIDKVRLGQHPESIGSADIDEIIIKPPVRGQLLGVLVRLHGGDPHRDADVTYLVQGLLHSGEEHGLEVPFASVVLLEDPRRPDRLVATDAVQLDHVVYERPSPHGIEGLLGRFRDSELVGKFFFLRFY